MDGTVEGCGLVHEVLATIELVLAATLVDCSAGLAGGFPVVRWVVASGTSSTVFVAIWTGAVLVVASVWVVAGSVVVLASVVVEGSVVVLAGCVGSVVVVGASVGVVVVGAGVSARVETCVVSTVLVDGHPFDSCWQHHAFQSGVHAHSQMSASASQS